MRLSLLRIAAGAILLAGTGFVPTAFAQSSDHAMQRSAAKDSALSHAAMSHENSMQHGTHMDSMSQSSKIQHDNAMKNAKSQ